MTRRRTYDRCARRAGFTLIEVVLAMGLLLLGATVILGLLSFGAAMARTADLRTLSAEAVDVVVADLEERLFPLEDGGRAGEPAPIVDRPVPGHERLVYSATAVPEPVDDDAPPVGREYRVDVEITWKGGGQARGRKFSILLVREVPFGERMRRAFQRSQESSAPVDPASPGTSSGPNSENPPESLD